MIIIEALTNGAQQVADDYGRSSQREMRAEADVSPNLLGNVVMRGTHYP